MIRILLASLTLAAAGCASTSDERDPAPVTASPDTSEVVSPGASEGLAVGTLPGQRLASGECGLFLFTPRPSPRFVFFGAASTGVGKMMLNDQELTLARMATDGEIVDQHYTEQTYRSATDITVTVSINPGKRSPTGVEIDNGSLRVDRDDGWTVVLPVSGSTHCAG